MNAPFYYTGIAIVVAGLFLAITTAGIKNDLAAFGLLFAIVGGVMIWYSKRDDQEVKPDATN